MSDSTGMFYRDIRKVMKILVVIVIAIAVIVASYISYILISESMQKVAREKEIMDKAMPFASSHSPWTYSRNDFGDKKILELWMLDDTDNHAIIKVNGKYSVYSTTTGFNGDMSLYHQAGEVCTYASAVLSNGSISSVRCDNDWYNGGPWNKFR
ncbi:hypothetical protein RE075_002215 [Klebsiella aerogenes]|nr:hypothetical protein [Klebsiella aerogenes]